jgi:hypothetical protein
MYYVSNEVNREEVPLKEDWDQNHGRVEHSSVLLRLG